MTDDDPWTSENGAGGETTAQMTATGSFDLTSGYGYDGNMGHAVVIHNAANERVGCGVLGDMPVDLALKLHAAITAYPDTESDIGGSVWVQEKADGSLTFEYDLTGLEKLSTFSVHIHTGVTCEESGGHYWTPMTDDDPWTSENGAGGETTAQMTATGSFDLTSGYGYNENMDHAVVVHNAANERVGCGVLGDMPSSGDMDDDQGSFNGGR
jgi:hypothetical protein